MKILQIIDKLDVGGAEKMVVLLANSQKKRGHDVSVLTILNPGPLAEQLHSGIPVIALYRKWKFNLCTMYRLVQIAKSFDIIHVHSSHNLRYVYLASRLFGLKKVIFFHEHFGNVEIDQSVRWHQRLIYPSVKVIGVSQKICQWAKEKVRVPAKNIHFLPNTVPDFPFLPNYHSRQGQEFSLLLTSNLRFPKNIEFALILLEALNTANLTIIGQAVDRKYYAELLSQISQLGLSKRIKFIHDCASIQPILNQFDLAIHTSMSESGPLVLIEYLAQGLPFLTYRTGEIACKVEEEFPDFVIDNFQAEQWVERIHQLLSRDRQTLGKAMRRFYEAQFSEDSYYEQCQKIYHKGLLS